MHVYICLNSGHAVERAFVLRSLEKAEMAETAETLKIAEEACYEATMLSIHLSN